MEENAKPAAEIHGILFYNNLKDAYNTSMEFLRYSLQDDDFNQVLLHVNTNFILNIVHGMTDEQVSYFFSKIMNIREAKKNGRKC